MSSGKLGPVIVILEHAPDSWYGTGKARLARRSVHIAMAKYANSQGKNIWASEARIGYTAKVAVSTAREAIKFFVDTNRLIERGVHPVYGTKVYDLVLPTEAEAEQAKRESSQALETERTRTRQRVAKFRQQNAEPGTPCNAGVDVTELRDVTPNTVLRNAEQRVTVTPDTALCNAQTGVDLSFDLSVNLSERERTESLSPGNDENQKPETPIPQGGTGEANYGSFREEWKRHAGITGIHTRQMETQYGDLAAKHGEAEVLAAIPAGVEKLRGKSRVAFDAVFDEIFGSKSGHKPKRLSDGWSARKFLFDYAEDIIEARRAGYVLPEHEQESSLGEFPILTAPD